MFMSSDIKLNGVTPRPERLPEIVLAGLSGARADFPSQDHARGYGRRRLNSAPARLA
jgi:hypothetical protein